MSIPCLRTWLERRQLRLGPKVQQTSPARCHQSLRLWMKDSFFWSLETVCENSCVEVAIARSFRTLVAAEYLVSGDFWGWPWRRCSWSLWLCRSCWIVQQVVNPWVIDRDGLKIFHLDTLRNICLTESFVPRVRTFGIFWSNNFVFGWAHARFFVDANAFPSIWSLILLHSCHYFILPCMQKPGKLLVVILGFMPCLFAKYVAPEGQWNFPSSPVVEVKSIWNI